MCAECDTFQWSLYDRFRQKQSVERVRISLKAANQRFEQFLAPPSPPLTPLMPATPILEAVHTALSDTASVFETASVSDDTASVRSGSSRLSLRKRKVMQSLAAIETGSVASGSTAGDAGSSTESDTELDRKHRTGPKPASLPGPVVPATDPSTDEVGATSTTETPSKRLKPTEVVEPEPIPVVATSPPPPAPPVPEQDSAFNLELELSQPPASQLSQPLALTAAPISVSGSGSGGGEKQLPPNVLEHVRSLQSKISAYADPTPTTSLALSQVTSASATAERRLLIEATASLLLSVSDEHFGLICESKRLAAPVIATATAAAATDSPSSGLGLESLPEELLHALCVAVFIETLSYSRAVQFIAAVLLPVVHRLQPTQRRTLHVSAGR